MSEKAELCRAAMNVCTMTNNHETKSPELIEFARMLLQATYEETLNIVVSMGKDIACSDRCSLIIQNKKGELVVKAGIPREDHKIGHRIDLKYAIILKEILERGDGLISVKDISFPSDLGYAIGLNMSYIKLALYMPLHFKGEPIGLIVFSYTNGDYQRRLNIDSFQKIKLMGTLAATAIGSAYERKRREKEIARKERLTILGENSASVAHIIRNSLTCIGGFAARLNSKLLTAENNGNLEKAKDYSDIIVKEIRKLEKITNDVLTYTMLSSKKLNFDNCNVNQFLMDFIDRYSHEFPNLQIHFYPDSHDINSYIDKDAIEMCLENLIRNAIEAKAKNIYIKTKLKAKDRKLSISIINDGIRICQTVMDKIFDPFMTTKPDGTGLGLANTQAIVSAHNGEIFVVSDEYKTEFKILLPITQREN